MQLLYASQPPRARRPDGREVSLAPLDAALLAWLAIEGPTPRTRLLALLWPEADATAARNTLRQRLFQLRRSLGGEVVAGSTTVALAAGVTHDLAEPGTPFEHAAPRDAGEFAQWHEAQRQARRGHVRAGMLAEIERAERDADWPRAAAAAQRLVALDPLREDAWRAEMRIHYLAGDRAAAVAAFDRCESALKHELGTRPGAETLALLAQIESGTGVNPQALAVGQPVPVALLRPPLLIGRDAERARVVEALAARRVVVLLGEAGIGKSRLIAETLTVLASLGAGPSQRLVATSARIGDSAVGHALSARWLRELLASGHAPPAAERRVLARLLPELATPSHADALDSTGTPLHLVRAVEAWLEAAAAAEPPLAAVVIDDFHHADDASVELLRGLIANPACGWLLATRPGEGGGAVARTLAEHEAASTTVHVALAPLRSDDVARLLDSLRIDGVASADAAALHARTGGNPFFVLETLKARRGRAPRRLVPAAAGRVADWPELPEVRRLLSQRMARCSVPAQRLLQCAAVAGAALTADLAGDVLGVAPIELAAPWRELQAAQLFGERDFAHDLIGEAALAALPSPIVRSLHGKVAAALERRGDEPDRIAAHWLGSEQTARAEPHLVAAAERALQTFRHLDAAAAWTRAGELALAEGARDRAFARFFQAAHAHLSLPLDDALVDLSGRLTQLARDGVEQALALEVEVHVLISRHRLDAALSAAERGTALAAASGADDVAGAIQYALSIVLWEQHRPQPALEAGLRALGHLERADAARHGRDLDELRQRASYALGVFLVGLGRYAEAERHTLRSRDIANRRGQEADTNIARQLAHAALQRGDLAAARTNLAGVRWRDRLSFAEEIRLAGAEGQVALACGDLGLGLGKLRYAAERARRELRSGAVFLGRQFHVLQGELGRADLARQGLLALGNELELDPLEALMIRSALLDLGEPRTPADDDLLERSIAIDQVGLRVATLAHLAGRWPATDLLPVLALAAGDAEQRGAGAQWLTLQARRCAVLNREGRGDEAAVLARRVWAMVEQGTVGTELYPRIAAPLWAALREVDAGLAEVIALRAAAWMQHAASTLEPGWRSSFLRRAPVMAQLPAAARALLRVQA